MDFRHVDDLWDDEVAATLEPVERLVYRSNLLGRDQRVTNTGGGTAPLMTDLVDAVLPAVGGAGRE